MLINTPTQKLLECVEQHIAVRKELSQQPRVLEAFQRLQQVSEVVPSFVTFVEEDPRFSSARVDFSQQEITLIQMYLLLRVLSTYATIPLLVGHLHLLGEYELAARINSNASDEGGGKGKASHHELLVNSLEIVAQHLGGLPVTTKRLLAAIQIDELRKCAESKLEDYESLWTHLTKADKYVPIQKEELEIAIEISKMLDDNMLRYHQHVHQTLLIPAMLKPFSKQVLALAALELAKREAESVDEKDGNLSFIGTWERLVGFYRNQLSAEQYQIANAWAAAHNDEEEAKKAGWMDRSAEDGHARDARDVALHFLAVLNPEEFAQVLEQVAENTRLRLQHWDCLVASLRSLRLIPNAETMYSNSLGILDSRAPAHSSNQGLIQ